MRVGYLLQPAQSGQLSPQHSTQALSLQQALQDEPAACNGWKAAATASIAMVKNVFIICSFRGLEWMIGWNPPGAVLPHGGTARSAMRQRGGGTGGRSDRCGKSGEQSARSEPVRRGGWKPAAEVAWMSGAAGAARGQVGQRQSFAAAEGASQQSSCGQHMWGAGAVWGREAARCGAGETMSASAATIANHDGRYPHMAQRYRRLRGIQAGGGGFIAWGNRGWRAGRF